MTDEQIKIRGIEAKQLLNNRLFKEAFESVETYLLNQAKSADPDNKDKLQRIVIAMQIHEALKREIERIVDDGVVAEMRIAEVEGRRKLFQFRR